jgi:MoaA/NifB/PqqE/SkfB family radical SAM enzyme
VREKHRDEVDRIVKEAYDELKDLSSKGLKAGSVVTAWEILQKHLGKVAELAKDAGEDIVNNHPQLTHRFGGEFERLKQMGEKYGPEAKKQVDETWNKVRDALKGGFRP